MATYKHKVANPVPLLAIVNPKGGKMVTRKRKTAAKRRPARRATAAVRSRSTTAHLRKSNPTRRRKVTAAKSKRRVTRRRSNPTGGLGNEILDFTLAGVGLGIAQPFVAPMIARFLPLGTFTQPAAAAISGYGLGWLAEKFAMTKRFGRPLKVLGISAAAIGVVSPMVRGLIGGGSAPVPQQQGMQGWRAAPQRRGLNGIALIPDIPPSVVPLPPPKARQGMNGVAAVPQQFRR